MHIVHFPSSAVHVLQLSAYFVIAVCYASHIVVEGVPPSCPFVLCPCSGAIVASTSDFRVSSRHIEDSRVDVLLSAPLSFLVFFWFLGFFFSSSSLLSVVGISNRRVVLLVVRVDV
jgi:hypothetical protein